VRGESRGSQTPANHLTIDTRIVPRAADTGCPCGCRTRPPWLDDPACIRHRPLRLSLHPCPGMFGPDGRWVPHCHEEAA
jgi:hypothetical protein